MGGGGRGRISGSGGPELPAQQGCCPCQVAVRPRGAGGDGDGTTGLPGNEGSFQL